MKDLTILYPTVARRGGETPFSWLCRLELVHSGTSSHAFCDALGLSRAGVRRGDEEALRELASLGGEEPARLIADALKRPDRGKFLYRGETLCSRTVLRDRVRYCPVCLAEDARDHPFRVGRPWAHRTIWNLRCVVVCPEHEVLWTEVTLKDHPASLFRFHDLIDTWPGGVAEALRVGRSATPTSLQRYVLQRLEGRSGPDFLDAHALHHAINVTELVGAIAIRGPRIILDVKGLGAAEEIETGFEIMSDGPDALRRLLQDLAAKTDTSRLKRFAPRAIFGAAHTFFAGGGPGQFAQPAREVFREVLFETFPYEEGQNVGREPAPARTMIAPHQLSKSLRAHPKPFRRVPEAEGVIGSCDASSPNFILLDATGAEMLAHDLNSALRSIDLPNYLGCSHHVAESITRHELIPCVGGGRGRLRRTGYRREDLDRFMRQLVELALPWEGEAQGWLPLGALTRSLGVNSGEVIDKVISSDLTEVRHIVAAGRGINVLRFCLPTAKAFFRKGGDLDELPASAAARSLRIAHSAVITLAEPAWGDRGLRPSRWVLWHRRTRPVFNREDVEAFRHRYVSLTEAARALRLFPHEAICRLEARGILPAFPPGRISIRLYERNDRFFQAIGEA